MAESAGADAMLVVSKKDECSAYGAYPNYYNALREHGQGVHLIVSERHTHGDLLDVLRGCVVHDGDESLLLQMQRHLRNGASSTAV